jgi:hypothetical protein
VVSELDLFIGCGEFASSANGTVWIFQPALLEYLAPAGGHIHAGGVRAEAGLVEIDAERVRVADLLDALADLRDIGPLDWEPRQTEYRREQFPESEAS